MLEKLGQLFEDPKRQEEYRDFERRYQEQPDQISDEEAARRYREIMAHMDNEDEETEAAYERAFSKLTPEERRALAERFREAKEDSGRPYQGYQSSDIDTASSPRELGRMTRRAAQEDPDLLEQVVGQNSPLTGTAGRMALAGLAVFAAKRFLGRR